MPSIIHRAQAPCRQLLALTFLSCSSIHEYTHEAKITAAHDLECSEAQIYVDTLEPTASQWPDNGCPRASLVARGCGKEQEYECSSIRKTSNPCQTSCRARGSVGDPLEGVPGGPGHLGTHIIAAEQRTGHHHVASCRPKDATGSGVDMMVYVIGLNHDRTPSNKPGDSASPEAVKQLAATIYGSNLANPERIVIVSSAFNARCAPNCGVALKDELERLYNHRYKFHLQAVVAQPEFPRAGTIGVISGESWVPEGAVESIFPPTNPGQAIARVFLRHKRTNLIAPVYAVHTADAYASTHEIVAATKATGGRPPVGALTSLIAGDFNMQEYGEAAHQSTEAATLYRNNYAWFNDRVECESGTVFHTENGNKMHIVNGRFENPEGDAYLAFPCASARFERVRFDYSVDAVGNLIPHGEREGILLDGIGHNVLAFGLRIVQRSVSASCQAKTCNCPAGFICDSRNGVCRPDPTPPCPNAATPWCECTQSCLRHPLCRKAEDDDRCQ